MKKIEKNLRSKEKIPQAWDRLFGEAEEYLVRLGFHKKLEKGEVSFSELKQLFFRNINRYLKGEVDQNFILGLNEIFRQIVIGGDVEVDEDFFMILHDLSDIADDIVFHKKPTKSYQERDQVIRDVFERLK